MPPWSILAQVKETGTTIVWLRCRPIFHKRSTSWTRDHVLEIIFLHHEHHDHDHHLDHHHDDYHHDHHDHYHQHHHQQHQHQHHHHHHHHNRHHHLFVIVPLPPQTWLLIASRSRNRCQFKIVPMHSNTFQLTIWPTMMHLVSGTCLQKTNADQSHPLTLRSDDYIVDSDLRNNNLRIDQISNLQVFFSRLLLAKTYGQRVFLKECPKFFILTTCSYLSRESITATMRCHICQVSRLLYHSCKDASSRIAWKSIWACPVLPRQGFLSLWGLWLQALCLSRFFLMKDVAFNEKAATIY